MSKKNTASSPLRITGKELFLSLAGALLFSSGVNFFIVPSGIYNGGVLGISQLLNTFLRNIFPVINNFPFVSVVYYLLNVPLFYLAYRQLGHHFFFRSVICVTAETIFLALIPSPSAMLVDSTITSTIIGGLMAGAGSGMIFLARSSAGGLDIIGMYLTKKYKMLSIGKLSMGVNAIIYAICALSLDVSVAIYSIIYSVVSSMVIDRIHEQNICTEMTIFTKKDPENVINFITNSLGRSATYWEGTSGYSHDPSYIIYTVVSKYEAHRLEAFLKEYDSRIFAIKNHGVAIEGNFQKKL
ncbi:MAG: YitT family protein [Clostridiales bacterium]|nr:YitT family protein [Clostridiales bacterium]